jgi:uncharacterized protein
MQEVRTHPNVNELQFNVAQLLKEVSGATRKYQLDITYPDIEPALLLTDTIKGDLRFLRTALGILVQGAMSTAVELNCTRCLKDFEKRLEIEIEEEFRPTIDINTGIPLPDDKEVDVANWITDQHILDLSEVARQDLLLGLPAYPICSPACRGLCPTCGADRNIEPCNCPEEEIDPRWSALIRKI